MLASKNISINGSLAIGKGFIEEQAIAKSAAKVYHAPPCYSATEKTYLPPSPEHLQTSSKEGQSIVAAAAATS